MYASTAIGVYVPRMKAIGVTAKLGEDQFGFTMGHEVAHWIDNNVGKSKGKRHASDDYESTAGQIATTFRKEMNQASDSKYLNATHECFARAFEMYNAITTKGVDAIRGNEKKGEMYVNSPAYVSFSTYKEKIEPLIKQFLEENKEILKSIGIDILNWE
jgi:hypothetical protein